MNYFEDHIGDYAAATSHLSWDEDMAYTRLIRAYYHSERPIPAGQAYRLARATTPAQRRAVDSVLAEFFTAEEDGHHQKRCDEEIARFRDKQSKAKRSAEARWSALPTQSDGNANAMRTHSERNANGMPRAPVPDTRHQTPDTKEENPPASRVPPKASPRATTKCPAGFEVTAELRGWAKEKVPGVNVDRETEVFRDHTFATARTDWAGTWRNWMRKALSQQSRNGHQSPSGDIFGGAL